MDRFNKRVICGLVAAALVGCNDDSSSNSSSQPQTQVRSIGTELVSGKITSSTNEPISKGEVTLIFQDSEGSAITEFTTLSDDGGFYKAVIPELMASTHQAAKLVVAFNKLGFASNEKVVDVDLDSMRVSVDATLAPVTVSTIKRSDLEDIVVSSNGTPSLRFSLVKNSQGEKRILVGNVMAAADEDIELSIDLPVANIPEDVEAINSEIAYFDSSNIDDLQSFPGDFVGQGETEDQGQGVSFNPADEDESYRLVSSTFSQIKLTDENQEPLPLQDILASSDSSPSMMMMVPKGSYSTIQRDFDLNTDNIQIPIYVYYSSKGWQYVGNGVLTTDSAGQSPALPEDVNMDEDGNINLDGTEDIQLYVKVEITEANEWIQWINLDWPIKTGENIEMCFDGTATYGNGEAFYGYVWFTLPDGGSDWAYAENGTFQYRANVLGEEADIINATNWSVSLTNTKTGAREEIVLPDNLVAGACNEIPPKQLINPYSCEVTGYVYQSDGATPIQNIFVEITSERSREFATTNELGAYSQAVLCDAPLTITALGQDKQTVSSSASPAVVDFSKENQPPILAALRRGSEDIKIDQSVLFSWSVSDPDGDATNVDVTCEANDDCLVTEDGNNAVVEFNTIGSKLVTISASDGKATTKQSFPINVRDTDNFAPEIIGFEVNGTLYSVSEKVTVQQNSEVNVTATVRDRNGDTLTSVWVGCEDSSSFLCSVNTETIESKTLTLNVTDDHSNPLTTTAGMTVNVVDDSAPVISILSATPTLVGSDGSSNIIPITLFAEFSDDFTPYSELIYTWLLTDQDGQDFSDLLGDDPKVSIVLPKGSLAIGEYTALLSVTDNALEPQTVTESVSFTVQDNTQPTVILVSDVTEEVIPSETFFGNEINLTSTVSDDDGIENVTITWTMKQGDSDLSSSLNLTDDQLKATIPAGTLAEGVFVVSVTAMDEYGLEATSQVSITINEDQAPTISAFTATPSSQNATEDGVNSENIELIVNAIDDYDSSLTYQWSFEPQIPAQLDTDKATISAGSIGIGSYQATISVIDKLNQSSTQSISFSVLDFSGNVGIIIE
ncbi:hypothetical protein H5300_09720 [Vibrio sp. SG41-7]|uniref:hypothetical protein n=1 Tax=Vibrio sp. SG41-7 TaxID=2760973 RepID=UPI0016021047|nr:hypothetical protein [Vibrio sp. SG41-7]MBB1463591.1 hypothetical protein [Vibrio sp. SG41-7]